MTHVDVSRFFGDTNVTFVLLDPETSRLRVHNPDRAGRRFVPASTFKIVSSLVALETGVSTGPESDLLGQRERAARREALE